MTPDPFALARELLIEDDAYIRLRSFAADRPDEPTELILDNRMWFSDISNQDDIFEGQPRFRWRTQVDLLGDLTRLATRQAHVSDGAVATQIAEDYFRRLQDPVELAGAQRAMQERYAGIYRSSSIACFFRNPFEPRHWHAYADRGRGYGLIFDFTRPWRFEGFHGFGPAEAVPFELDYVPPMQRPIIELAFAPSEPSFDDIRRALLTKSDAWREQREERLIRVGVPPGHVAFPPESLKAVVLGHQILPDRRDHLVHLAARRDIPIAIYQARPSAEHLALELVEVGL